jgi:hypothetical protein
MMTMIIIDRVRLNGRIILKRVLKEPYDVRLRTGIFRTSGIE